MSISYSAKLIIGLSGKEIIDKLPWIYDENIELGDWAENQGLALATQGYDNSPEDWFMGVEVEITNLNSTVIAKLIDAAHVTFHEITHGVHGMTKVCLDVN